MLLLLWVLLLLRIVVVAALIVHELLLTCAHLRLRQQDALIVVWIGVVDNEGIVAPEAHHALCPNV